MWGNHDMFKGQRAWRDSMHRTMMEYVMAEQYFCPSATHEPGMPYGWADSYPKGYWSQMDYWPFAVVTDHPSYLDANGHPKPPRFGCIYDGGGNYHLPRRDLTTKRKDTAKLLYMDRGWHRDGSHAVYKYRSWGRISNHQLRGSTPYSNGSVDAEGVNGLMPAGAVMWITYLDDPQWYHKDYYRHFYVDKDWYERF